MHTRMAEAQAATRLPLRRRAPSSPDVMLDLVLSPGMQSSLEYSLVLVCMISAKRVNRGRAGPGYVAREPRLRVGRSLKFLRVMFAGGWFAVMPPPVFCCIRLCWLRRSGLTGVDARVERCPDLKGGANLAGFSPARGVQPVDERPGHGDLPAHTPSAYRGAAGRPPGEGG